MEVIAQCIADCLFDFEGRRQQVTERVAELVKAFPIYG